MSIGPLPPPNTMALAAAVNAVPARPSGEMNTDKGGQPRDEEFLAALEAASGSTGAPDATVTDRTDESEHPRKAYAEKEKTGEHRAVLLGHTWRATTLGLPPSDAAGALALPAALIAHGTLAAGHPTLGDLSADAPPVAVVGIGVVTEPGSAGRTRGRRTDGTPDLDGGPAGPAAPTTSMFALAAGAQGLPVAPPARAPTLTIVPAGGARSAVTAALGAATTPPTRVGLPPGTAPATVPATAPVIGHAAASRNPGASSGVPVLAADAGRPLLTVVGGAGRLSSPGPNSGARGAPSSGVPTDTPLRVPASQPLGTGPGPVTAHPGGRPPIHPGTATPAVRMPVGTAKTVLSPAALAPTPLTPTPLTPSVPTQSGHATTVPTQATSASASTASTQATTTSASPASTQATSASASTASTQATTTSASPAWTQATTASASTAWTQATTASASPASTQTTSASAAGLGRGQRVRIGAAITGGGTVPAHAAPLGALAVPAQPGLLQVVPQQPTTPRPPARPDAIPLGAAGAPLGAAGWGGTPAAPATARRRTDEDAGHGSASPDPTLFAPLPALVTAPATPAIDLPGASQPTPTPAVQVADQIIPLRSENGVHRIAMELRPNDLGTVNVVAEIRNGHVQLHFGGANEMTREALRAALPELRQQLENAGFADAGFDFGDSPANQNAASQFGGADQSGGGKQPGRGGDTPAPATRRPTAPNPGYRSPTIADRPGLDLQV